MTFLRASSLVCVAALAAACSGPVADDGGAVATSTSAIVNGMPSPEDEDFVVDLLARGAGSCTGTLIAPNVVLTAFHCVSNYDEGARFSCDSDGRLTSTTPGGGVLGEPVDPKTVAIRVGPASSSDDPVAYGVEIFAADTTNICLNDIAVVVLDTELTQPPQQVRLRSRTAVGELVTAIGYGQDENGTVRIRNRRSGIRVTGVGEFGQFEAEGAKVPPRAFVVGQGPCHGDSGGPAFSEATGAIIGVYSAVFSDCVAPGVKNVFTQVAAFGTLINEAMEFAGAELLVEPPQVEPVGGSAGTAGSAPGGSTAVGGSSGGSGGASSAGVAGSDSGEAGRGGTRTGSGTGSREDVSCACRLAGLASSNGAPEWAGFLSLLLGTFLRRRRR